MNIQEKWKRRAGEQAENLTLPKELPPEDKPTGPEGLTEAEAAEIRQAGGGNKATADPGKSLLRIVADNLFTLFNLLNVLLAVALGLVQAWRNMLFLGVVVSNTLIGTVQEIRAKKTVQRLKLLSQAPVRVIREGTERKVNAEECVRGDLVVLRAGDQIPADAIMVRGVCACSEAVLTGEQNAVEKHDGDWLYSGSYLSSGRCVCRLVYVGDQSYVNRLSRAARKIQPPASRLMQDLAKLIRWVSMAIVPMGLLLFLKQYLWLHLDMTSSVTGTVAAVLGMIPEGLMLLTSVALMVGVIRLGKKRTLVQELYGIETLARVDTLCLDKTGTLTTGNMTLARMIPLETDLSAMRKYLSRYTGAVDRSSPTLDAICRVVKPGEEQAAALIPFTSEKKRAAATFEDGTTLMLGAPSFVLGADYGGEVQRLTEEAALQGMRVVLLAEGDGPVTGGEFPGVKRKLGLCLISDEVRASAPDGLRYFREQGVTVKVISGDDPRTVASVAEQAGLAGAAARAVDVSRLADEELEEAAEQYLVFGRVTPERKQKLVAAMQRKGHHVAMTGDGVNDIPAMKTADCSIAMAGGADAARHASQLILLDSDFAALPQVVAEGRRVINNIARTAALFLVKTLYSCALSLLMLFLPVGYPFQPIQLTLISSLTIGMPSFFLALEPNAERVRGNFLQRVLQRAVPGGAAVTLCAAASAMMQFSWSREVCSTVATLAAGSVGLLMLLTVCLPLNRRRGILLAGMTGLFVAAVLLAGRVFFLAPLEGGQLAALFGMIAAGAAVLFGLRILFKRMEAKKGESS